MPPILPLYTAANSPLAFQLNWSLTVFLRTAVPPSVEWLEPLTLSTEPDGVRILEHHVATERAHQFLVSTLPHVPPASVIRSIKGRWQHLLRDAAPKALQRHYRITSVGSAELASLDTYVGNQADRHAMADSRIQARMRTWQFHDPRVHLERLRRNEHGQFMYNLHFVFELTEGELCLETTLWEARKAMMIRAAARKRHLLARLGIVANHVHILLGCGLLETPQDVGLSLVNNLAFVEQMRPAFRFGFFVGTVGTYNLCAVRRRLSARRW